MFCTNSVGLGHRRIEHLVFKPEHDRAELLTFIPGQTEPIAGRAELFVNGLCPGQVKSPSADLQHISKTNPT